MRRFVLQLLFSVALLTTVAKLILADDWPTFRGQDRTAISLETGLLDTWGQEGPELLFTAIGAGRGYASPALSAGRMFILGDGPSTTADSDEYLTCFDASTGDLIWSQRTGPAWNSGRASWQGSRGTPSVDGDFVYVITPFGKLVAATTANGEIAWQRDLREDFGGDKGDPWGYSESPLVDGDKVICTPGGSESTVVALDRTTGALIWACQRPDDLGAGHSSVIISTIGGRKVYVQNTAGGPLGIDAATGDLLWDYDREKPTAFIPTPVISGDLVLSICGYRRGAALLRQVANENGEISIEEIYSPKTELSNKHGGVVLIDGYIYGGSEDRSRFFCRDLNTGEVKWLENGSGDRSISVVAADGKFILHFQNGVVALVKADHTGYEEISSFKTPGSGGGDTPSWAHPVIANGKLYLREGDAILCYQISNTPDSTLGG